jgi:hypothetical protein
MTDNERSAVAAAHVRRALLLAAAAAAVAGLAAIINAQYTDSVFLAVVTAVLLVVRATRFRDRGG